MIRDGFVDSDKTNALSFEAECFYVRLILTCDDAGRFDGRPSLLRSRLFPLGPKGGNDPILMGLEECTKVGLIIPYRVNGKTYIQAMMWQKYGASSLSKFPCPSGTFDIRYVEIETKHGEKQFVDTSVPDSSIIVDTNTNTLYEDVYGKSRPHQDGVVTPSINPSAKGNGGAKKKSPKHKYGEYKHVLLAADQVQKLKDKFGDKYTDRIRDLDEGIQYKGYKYKDHYLTILKWARNDSKPKGNKPPSKVCEGLNADRDFEKEYEDQYQAQQAALVKQEAKSGNE